MIHWLRELTGLSEDPGSVLSTHMAKNGIIHKGNKTEENMN